jgi:hypothetical protein
MEKIAKNYALIIACLIGSCSTAQIPSFATSFEENDFTFNGNIIHETYAVEIPGADEALTYPLQQLGVKDNQLNIMFFSEVDDIFSFYVNGELKMTRNVNTKLDQNGKLPNLIFYPLQFPSGSSNAILTVKSLKYGQFQTEIKRSYPMLYLKRYNNEWYLNHNTVVKLPFQFFLPGSN